MRKTFNLKKIVGIVFGISSKYTKAQQSGPNFARPLHTIDKYDLSNVFIIFVIEIPSISNFTPKLFTRRGHMQSYAQNSGRRRRRRCHTIQTTIESIEIASVLTIVGANLWKSEIPIFSLSAAMNMHLISTRYNNMIIINATIAHRQTP